MKKFLKTLVAILVLVLLIIAGKHVYDRYQVYQMEKRAEEEIITVACVGDSLTFRRSYDGWPISNYPDVLAELLGEKYKVTNYGIAGTCVQADLENPYINTRAYGVSVEAEADILVIMLGTNDIWNSGWRDEETFYQHYITLIDSYLRTENQPEIYLCTIPDLFLIDNENLGSEFREKADKISTIIRQIAKERNYQLIEVHDYTSMHPEWYEADGIHFNLDGANALAEFVSNELQSDYIQKTIVSCIGDSNTFQLIGEENAISSYPTVLKKKVGNAYEVMNYGMPGATVQTCFEEPYIETQLYRKSLELDVDKLIIMLGTNDIWEQNSIDENNFYQDYSNILDSYLSENKISEVYLCTIATVYMENDSEWNYAQKTEQISNIIRRIAEERGFHLIDIHAYSLEHPEWFQEDGIHLNQLGANGVAEVVCDEIINYIE